MDYKNNESRLIKAVFLSSIVTMVMSNLTIFAGSTVDGVIISRFLGNSSMAAFQLSMPLSYAVVMIFQVFSIGVQNTCARLLGAGNGRDACSAYTTSIVILTGIGIIIGVAAAVFRSPLSLMLGAAKDKESLAWDLSQYILGISFQFPALCIIPLINAVMFLEGRGKSVINAFIIQAVVDIAGDLLNVFVFKQGMFGIGLATSVCVYTSLLYLIFARFRDKPVIHVDRSTFWPSSLKEVFRVGTPAAVDRVYKTVQMFTVNRVLASVAMKAEIAALGAITTLNNIYNPVIMGIGTAVLTMVAVFYGERDEKSIRSLMRYAVKVTIAAELCVALASILGAPFLMRLFFRGTNLDDLNIAVRALRIYVLYLPVYGVNYMFQKYYNSIGNLKMTYILSAFDNLIYICLLALILGHYCGSDGVFFAFVCAEILTTLSMILIMSVKLHRVPKCVDDMLDLPEDLHMPDEDQFSASVASGQDVIKASEGLKIFCRGKGMSGRQANRFSLAVEELGNNILSWGREKNKKATMDIRMYKTDGWALRIRDNGGLFDPTKWFEIHAAEDPLRNIGLRMVLKGAADVNYINAMKINNLIIKYERTRGEEKDEHGIQPLC